MELGRSKRWLARGGIGRGPLLRHIGTVIDWDADADETDADAVWERVEVYQATGMILGN